MLKHFAVDSLDTESGLMNGTKVEGAVGHAKPVNWPK